METESCLNIKEAYIQKYIYQQSLLAYQALEVQGTSCSAEELERLQGKNENDFHPQNPSRLSTADFLHCSNHHLVWDPITQLPIDTEDANVDAGDEIDVYSSVSNILPRHSSTSSLLSPLQNASSFPKKVSSRHSHLKKQPIALHSSSSKSPDLLAYLRQMALKRRQEVKNTRKYFKAPQGDSKNLNRGILLGNSKALQNFLAETQRSALKRVTLSKKGIQTKAIHGVPDLTFPANAPNFHVTDPSHSSISSSSSSSSYSSPSSPPSPSSSPSPSSPTSPSPSSRRISSDSVDLKKRSTLSYYGDDQTIHEVEALLEDASETDSLIRELELCAETIPRYLPNYHQP